MPTHQVGTRLSFNGDLCTVRYAGLLSGTAGSWLGVEWDDPARGKHNGSHGGMSVFKCKLDNSMYRLQGCSQWSSALTVNRLLPALEKAMRRKYVDEALTHKPGQDGESVAQYPKAVWISGKEVEEVGFDKEVAGLDDASEAIQRWPNIAELDLSRNLLEELREVLSICSRLERLRSLRIGFNRFRSLKLSDSEKEAAIRAFERTTHLSLESTLLPWDEICYVSNLFTCLMTLVATSNNLLNLSATCLPESLTILELEHNGFESLEYVSALACLPHLQRLNLKNNCISGPKGLSQNNLISRSLTTLDLSYNMIDSWAFIDGLASIFPELSSLRVSHNPLFQNLVHPDGRPLMPDDGYTLTIARLGNLTVMNFSTISAKERLDAELYYLSLITSEVINASTSRPQAVLALHPRYEHLATKHDRSALPDPASASSAIGIAAAGGNTLAARLLTLTFRVTAAVAAAGGASFTLQIPRSFSAYAVIGLVAKCLQLSPLAVRLVREQLDDGGGGGGGGSQSTPEDGNGNGNDNDVDVHDDEYDGDGGVGAGGTVGARAARGWAELEIVPGSRPIGTWIEGGGAVVRVELARVGGCAGFLGV